MSAQGEGPQRVVSWDELPREVLSRVLARVSLDQVALCAAVCVSRAWRDAAARLRQKSDVRLKKLPAAVARRLTDAGLAALVRRAHGRLVLLDLRGARLVTDEGLIRALQQPHTLTSFRANVSCRELTASAVVRALEPRRGLMRELRVRGLRCLASMPDFGSVGAWRDECRAVLDTLHQLLAPEGSLDGEYVCDGENCACICGYTDICKACDAAKCAGHQNGCFDTCDSCVEYFCKDTCLNEDGLCDECAPDDDDDSDDSDKHYRQELDWYPSDYD